MSRLYLVFVCLIFSCSVNSQTTNLKKYLEFAKEKYEKGDFIYAIDYYEKAMQYDSSTIDILWNYAQALRAYKDYSKAEYYYGKIFEKEGGEIYPESLLYYGLMLKQNQKYEEALSVFERGEKFYKNDRRGYLYLKTKNEVSSCRWAKTNLGDSSKIILEQLPETVNTSDAEFGHRVFNNELLYSSLRADSIGNKEEVYDPSYSTHLYKSKIEDSTYKEGVVIEDLFWNKLSAGNGAFSLDNNRFYFSLCKSDDYNYKCKILVAYFENDQFVEIDTLGSIINEPGYNTTMPFVGEWEGDEVLFFASDRPGGAGGMDVWYSFINNGNQFQKPQNPKLLNSVDNELSPYWDSQNNTLYFSSSWFNGFGGYDVFKSTYGEQGFEPPGNMMEPVNSSANDLYYFQTLSRDTAYFSSNRLGVNYSKNPTCCSDIFLVRNEFIPEPLEPTLEDSLEELTQMLPVTLYFHNDIPNPDSWDSTTNVNYIDVYNDYISMIDVYKEEYSSDLDDGVADEARVDIENFFVNYVEKGVEDLRMFRDLLLEVLKKGRKIQITIKGFASPLTKTDYNVNLTKRRISSFINYLYAYNNGIFQPYLDDVAENGGRLTFSQIPLGEYQADQTTSDDPNDVKNSIYSRAAAIERKVEIQSVDIIRDDDTLTTIISAEKQIVDFGDIKQGEVLNTQFTITNTGDRTITIERLRMSCDCVNAEIEFQTLKPKEKGNVLVTFNTEGYKGHEVKSVYVKYSGAKEELRLVVTADIH